MRLRHSMASLSLTPFTDNEGRVDVLRYDTFDVLLFSRQSSKINLLIILMRSFYQHQFQEDCLDLDHCNVLQKVV